MMMIACHWRDREISVKEFQELSPVDRSKVIGKLAGMRKADSPTPVEALLQEAVRDQAPIVRAAAMGVLADCPRPEDTELLAEGLVDSEESVRTATIAAIPRCRSDKLKVTLGRKYIQGGRETREAMVHALKATNYPGAMAALVASEAAALWARDTSLLDGGTIAERVGAAESLGGSGRPEAVTRLGGLLAAGDSPVALAVAAARGLGASGDEQRAPLALVNALRQNNPELREAAIGALVKLRSKSAIPSLLVLAHEPSPVSRTATQALLALPPSEEADNALCELLLKGDRADGRRIGRELQRRGGCLAEPFLKEAATSPQALLGLALFGRSLGDTPPPKLLKLLRSKVPLIRAGAAQALAQWSEIPRVREAINRACEEARTELEVAPAKSTSRTAEEGEALATLLTATENCAQGLEKHTSDTSPQVSAAAWARAVTLGKDGVGGLDDRSPLVVEATATALSRRDAAGQKTLVAALSGPAAPFALSALEGAPIAPEVKPLLAAALTTPGVDVVGIARLLGRLGYREAAPAVVALYEKSAMSERRALAVALGELGGEKAVAALLKELYSPSPELRGAAIRALGVIGDRNALEVADALKGDYYFDVREASGSALAVLAPVDAGNAP